MIHINAKEVNKIAKFNLLHDIINPSKRTKNLNNHYSHIIHGCMNNRQDRAKFKDLQIILDSGCSSMILIGRLFEKLHPEQDDVMQRHT